MELIVNFQQELIDAIAALSGENSWYNSPTAIALVSGIVAILGGLLSHYFNVYSEKQRQKAKFDIVILESEIRKQENIQEKQLEALMALSKISYAIQPSVWPRPDYESDEAYSDVVFAMGALLASLDEFLKNYSYIMPREINTQVNVVMFKCNEEHWGASTAETPDYQPGKKEIEAAKAVLNHLYGAVTDFKKVLGVTNA